MRCRMRFGRRTLPQSTLLLSAVLCTAGVLSADKAQGALITYTFADGTANGGPSAFDNSVNANGSRYYEADGVRLTSMNASGPAYASAGGSNWTWNGTTYLASGSSGFRTNFASGRLGMNGPVSGSVDAENFNPQESWVIAFDHKVILREIAVGSMESGNLMRVTFGTHTFNFAGSDFLPDETLADPFGPSLVIPQNTLITITNSASAPLTVSESAFGNLSWGLQGFTVETIPEPSTGLLAGGLLAVLLGGVRSMRKTRA